MKKNISTIIGVTSLAASLLGMYYLVKKNEGNSDAPSIDNPSEFPEVNPQQPNALQALIGTTVLAKKNNTTLFSVVDRGTYWERKDDIRLTAKKDDQLGKVIAIIADGFTTDTYAIIDIPFYVGPALSRGHGFINTNFIKSL
ncbi:hypothetical protein [Bizionia myxarmorum]|uniref:Uncharacterized protein n=1 Tax=Bizionia myxarmorum TaxID=291186 RepID=A0A5D0RC29_9FLAO|nr:hypothetical protein [Bizionia myxarmorum]TYB78335.1 hypothetical protein ES674_00715 [Bizionia myxarmorum]